MRRNNVCPKCNHNRILLIDSVPDTGEFDTQIRELHVAMTDSYGEKGRAGKLGAAVCRACGYTELYTEQPELIPVDGYYIREVTGATSEGPYR